MSNLIKWDNYHPEPVREILRKQVDVTCPKCEKRLWKRLDVVLTSNPPKYVYECDNCGFRGFNY